MKLKKLSCGAAVFGLAAGIAVGSVGVASATTTTLHPYADWSFGANTAAFTGVGSTHPGFADSDLCLNFAAAGDGIQIDGASGHGAANAHYSGKVNGVVVNAATVVDQLIVLKDLLTTTPACTLTSFVVDDAGTASAVTSATKHQGTITTSTSAQVQSGIFAVSKTVLRINYDAGMTVSLPSGATVVGGALTGGSSVDLSLKPVTVQTKAVLDPAACEDVDHMIDLSTLDDISASPTAGDIADYNPLSSATQNVATIRQCAESQTPINGKAVKTVIKIAGAGNASASFLYAQTVNPRIWDTTRGTSCSAAKEPSGPSLRVITCKGAYGPVIPLTLSVRGANPANAGIDPKGLVHPLPPVLLAGSSLSIP